MAKPEGHGGEVPYVEVITHKALGGELEARGVFYATGRGSLVRRQISPKPENMEISIDTIKIVRNGSEVTRHIPAKLAPFLTLIRDIVLETEPEPEFLARAELTVDEAGWNVTVRAPDSGWNTLTLWGCGQKLNAIGVEISAIQSRSIRFSKK